MATPLFTTLSLAAATAISTGLACYYWRRSHGLYSLLLEGANRYEELRQRAGLIESNAVKAQQTATKDRESLLQLEKAIQEARTNNAKLIHDLQTKDHEVALIRERLEAQRGHLERHLTKVTQDLQVSEGARILAEQRGHEEVSTLSVRLKNDHKHYEQKITALQLELSLRDRDLAGRLQELEKEKLALEKRAKLLDPLEIKRLRRKLGGYERLYASMKGLRDMTDERNRNWEVALRKLASYIVTLKHGGKGATPEAIGPLVGEALELIGAQLVDEQVDFSPVRESASAQKVEADIESLNFDSEDTTGQTLASF
jgi:hypothetical protein